MALTNVFLNSYKQPENKLTYNLLCLLEHMPQQRQFCEFLTDGWIKLASNPIEEIQTVFSGKASNPDGAFVLLDTNRQRWTLFFENKTWRRSLDTCQLQNHLALHCKKPNELLLVITPRASDRSTAKSVSKQVVFKTWDQITTKLIEINRELDESPFIISQFIDYGKRTGEFMSMEIEKSELEAYVLTVKSNVHGKIAGLLNTISANFDFGKFGIKNASSEIEDRWGRHGLVITFESQKDYGQWMFFGIYYDESDHLIAFKQSGIPELAFFLDIEPQKREILKSVKGIEADIAALQRQGFDDNLFSKLTSNNWRFLAKRKSLTDVNGLTEAALSAFLTSALQSLKEESIIWREMF